MVGNFKLDLDRLHSVYEVESQGERCKKEAGRTTLFCYDMIGVALSEAFNFTQENPQIVNVYYTKPTPNIFETIKQLHRICRSENVFYNVIQREPTLRISLRPIFIIHKTAFRFVNDSEDMKDHIYKSETLWEGTDCMVLDEELKDPSYIKDFYSYLGLKSYMVDGDEMQTLSKQLSRLRKEHNINIKP